MKETTKIENVKIDRYDKKKKKQVTVGPRSHQPKSLNPKNAANIKSNCFLILATMLENNKVNA